jgi:hypothetical protein
MCTSSSAGAAKTNARRAATNRYFINYYISYPCQLCELVLRKANNYRTYPKMAKIPFFRLNQGNYEQVLKAE